MGQFCANWALFDSLGRFFLKRKEPNNLEPIWAIFESEEKSSFSMYCRLQKLYNFAIFRVLGHNFLKLSDNFGYILANLVTF
jgi:hypothetical protein